MASLSSQLSAWHFAYAFSDLSQRSSSFSLDTAAALELDSERFSSRHWSIVACSAVTGEGLLAGMDWMTDDISSRIFMLA